MSGWPCPKTMKNVMLFDLRAMLIAEIKGKSKEGRSEQNKLHHLGRVLLWRKSVGKDGLCPCEQRLWPTLTVTSLYYCSDT